MSAAATAALRSATARTEIGRPSALRQRLAEFPGEFLRPFRPAAPDRDLRDRPHLGVHADELGRQRAGADHQQPPRIGPRQVARGQPRDAGGAPLGQRGAVEHRQGRPGGAVEQQVLAVDRRQPALAVVGEGGDHLDADQAGGAARPGRHQQQDGVGRPGPGRLGDGVVMARRHLATGAEQRVEPVDQRQVVEVGVDLGGRKDLHVKGPRVPDDDSSGATRALWRSIAF